MHKQMRVVASLLAVCLFALASAYAANSGDKVKDKGVIMERTADTILVKTSDGPYTVVFNTDTKIQHPVGLGARHKQMTPDVLIPGLRLKFEGVTDDQNRVVAKTIDYDEDDLSLAEVIQAGLHPTAEQQARNMETYAANKKATDARIEANKRSIAANQQEIEANKQRIAANEQGIQQVVQSTAKRFSELTDWVVKSQTEVHFDVGQDTISADNKQAIAALAQEALTTKGYVIEVKGFADSTGSLADNQVLSKQRAQAVVAYLLQECNVPVKNIVAPGAMSETHPVASNETSSGRAENRRVELKLLVNKGVAGDTGE
ncbi:MAG: OmpA family protein [Candidatus Sulfotelmatobacter sp.]